MLLLNILIYGYIIKNVIVLLMDRAEAREEYARENDPLYSYYP